jgi:hypothetical protein
MAIGGGPATPTANDFFFFFFLVWAIGGSQTTPYGLAGHPGFFKNIFIFIYF